MCHWTTLYRSWSDRIESICRRQYSRFSFRITVRKCLRSSRCLQSPWWCLLARRNASRASRQVSVHHGASRPSLAGCFPTVSSALRRRPRISVACKSSWSVVGVGGSGVKLCRPSSTMPAKVVSLFSGTEYRYCVLDTRMFLGMEIRIVSWSAPVWSLESTSAIAKGVFENVRSIVCPAACVGTPISPI